MSKELLRRLRDMRPWNPSSTTTGAAWLTMDQGLNVVTSILTTVVLTRVVGKEVYGAYVYLLGIFMLLIPLTLPGVSNATLQAVARGHEGVLRRGMGRRLAGGGLATLVLAALSVYFHFRGEDRLAWPLMLICVLYPFAFAADNYKAFLHGRQEYSRYAMINGAANLLVCLATVAAALYYGTLITILASNVLARGIANLVAYFLVQKSRRNDEIEPGFDRNSRNLSLVAAINGVSYTIDQVLVGSLFTLEIMASYGLATRISEPFRILALVVNRLAWPKAAKMEGPEVAGKFLSKLGPLLAGLAAMALFAIVVLPPIIGGVFPDYRDAIPLVKVMVLSAMLAVVVTYLETYFISQDRLRRFYYFASTARPVLTIALMWPFISWWGFFGAVYARMAVRFLSCLVLSLRMVMEWKSGTRNLGSP